MFCFSRFKHNLNKIKVRADLEKGFDGKEKLSILLTVIVGGSITESVVFTITVSL